MDLFISSESLSINDCRGSTFLFLLSGAIFKNNKSNNPIAYNEIAII